MAQLSPTNHEKSSVSSIFLILDLWKYLRPLRRRQLCALFVVMILSGLSELISLGAVIPFLSALSDPERFSSNHIIQAISDFLSVNNPKHTLVIVSLAFAFATILAALIRLANLWLNCRLAASIGSDFSAEAYKRVLYQPYKTYVSQNSSKLIISITTHTTKTVSSITALLQLLTSTFVVASILIGLFVYNWIVALTAAIFFSTCYGILVSTTKDRVLKNSKLIALYARQQIKSLQEGSGAIREIVMSGCQDVYLEKYMKADRPQRRYQASNLFLRSFPRFVVETVGLCTIILYALLSVIYSNSSASVVTLLGVLALGSQRLLPALQQIYSNWSNIRNLHADISAVLDMLRLPLPEQEHFCPGSFAHYLITLENVNFAFENTSENVLSNISLVIPHGQKLGIIGTTGSGKTTLIDLIMSLYAPTSGRLCVDNIAIEEYGNLKHLNAWRASVAHVPQSIYLADSTIAENIAFGLDEGDIDMERVMLSAKLAHISDYIEDSPKGYHSLVGEHGVKLSGGQRQRIGIARALYKQSKVIIFDEATSALDNETEAKIIETINSLQQKVTIIMIAHRLSTLRRCDRIISLQNGHIVRDGPPAEVLDGYNSSTGGLP